MSIEKDEKRVARIFGIEDNNELPDVTEDTLDIYYQYLNQDLVFPFEAAYSKETGPLENTYYDIVVTKVLDVDQSSDPEFYGLFCEAKEGRRKIIVPLAEVEVKGRGRNRQLINDYNMWFWNYR
ncbi:MAG: hypothetical protein JSW07_14540 [bacterium]|nr:MAG: hypothetical protein JSW07_14540 [bacterium]